MNYNLSDNIKNMKPSAIREIFKSLGTPGAISFAAGNPSPESFPVEDITRIANKILTENASAALQYGTTEGYAPLRELVTKRIADKFDCVKEGDMTIITSGGQQGIELFCKVMCNRGDEVICENPSFIGALNAFRSIGAVPVGVPLKDDGIDVEMLEEVLKTHTRVKFMYLIPTFQNPAGITTTLEKRKAVYALAQKYDVMILEDNPYGELRFAGKDVPTYKSMDTDGRVLYCGSFSKILSAGMRVGFVCGNETVVQKMVVAKQVEDVHTNQLFQMIVTGFMQECDMDAHVAKINALYKHKAELMIAALEKYMPKEVKFTRPEGGLFLWCTLPAGVSLDEFMKESIAQKVFVVTGKAFNCDETADSDSFRLNYSMPSDEEIDKGVKIIGEIIANLIKKNQD